MVSFFFASDIEESFPRNSWKWSAWLANVRDIATVSLINLPTRVKHVIQANCVNNYAKNPREIA